MQERKSFGKLIKQIHGAMEKEANNSLREHDLTLAQVSALVELSSFPDKQVPLKELERTLHVAQSTVAGIMSRLEQKGMVESFGDPADKRIKMVKITPQGERYVDGTEQQVAETENKVLTGLSAVEQGTLITLLEKVSDSL